MPKVSVGIIGYGHFGQFVEALVQRFLPEATVRIYSRRAAIDGKQFFSLPDTAASSVVLLCGAISEYEAQIASLVPHLSRETVVVDVATVKVYTETLCHSLLKQQPYVCLHPMFGPESYKKRAGNVSDLRIVWTTDTLGEHERQHAQDFLSKLGFRVVMMSSAEHDRLLAETLFLTHYVSQSMITAGFTRTAVDTASFSSLMDAVESVKNDRRLFEDVYRFNPYCKEIAERFHTAQETVFASLPKE